MNLGQRSTPPVHSDHASCNPPPVKRQAANDLTLKNRARNICPPAGQIVSALPTEMATACVMRNLTSSPMPTSSRSPKNEMGSRPARYRPRPRRSTGGPAVTGCWSVSNNLEMLGRPQDLGMVKNPFFTRSMRPCIDLPSKAGSADRRGTTQRPDPVHPRPSRHT